MRKEEERHIIKEEKSRNWGQGHTFIAGIQSIELPFRGKGKKTYYHPVSPAEKLEMVR